MSLNLAIVTPSHWESVRGGTQYQAKVLVDYLLEHYDVRVSYLTTRSNPAYEPPYEILKFSDPGGLRRYGFFFDSLRLYRALKRVRPDVIVQMVGCAHTGIAAFYAKRNRCRMLWRVSSDRSVVKERPRWWQIHRRVELAFLEYGIRNAHVILAQSRFQRAELERRFNRGDTSVLRNFHPVPPAPSDRRRQSGRVVWIATLKELKNPAAFVRLARRFSGRPDIRFVMVGRAAGDDEWTRRQLADIAAEPNVDYLGDRSQEDVNSILEQSDLLVNTSDWEGFSNTFIQAWLRAVPVVSLHVDPDELLSSGRLGAAAGGDEAELARIVGELLDAPARRAEMGARCRLYAEQNHSESNIDELARLLRAPALPSMTDPEPA